MNTEIIVYNEAGDAQSFIMDLDCIPNIRDEIDVSDEVAEKIDIKFDKEYLRVFDKCWDLFSADPCVRIYAR